MKKLFSLPVLCTMVLVLSSCNQQEPPKQTNLTTTTEQTSQTNRTKPQTDTTIDVEEIVSALNDGNISVNGVYYEKRENGDYRIIGGNPVTSNMEFTGKFLNIQNILWNKSNESEIVVSFTANIEDDSYKITEAIGIQAFLQVNQDNTLSFRSASIVDDTIPLVAPIYEFDKEYLYDKQYEITYRVAGNEYDEETYLFPGATAEYDEIYGKYTGGSYLITFVLSHETVEDITILLDYNNLFKMTKPTIILTLPNGISIRTTADIYYNPNKDDTYTTPSEYWHVDLAFLGWGIVRD